MDEKTIERSPTAQLPKQMRAGILHILRTRRAPSGTLAARVEGTLKHGGSIAWGQMEKRPLAGSVVIGGMGLLAAMAIGVGELTLAVLCGYAAFQVLREKAPAREVAERVISELEGVR